MRKLLYFGIFLIIGLIVVYGVIVIYGNVSALNANPFSVPDVEKAQYSIRIENTGLTFFSNGVEQQGKIVVLNNYWELVGQKYKFRDKSFIIDQTHWGPVRIIKRQ